VARFEFRTFARCLGVTEDLMRALSPCEGIDESLEIYLFCGDNDPHRNVKIRDGRLELKRIVEHSQELERWQPAGQWEFPVDRDILHDSLWPDSAGLADDRSERMSRSELLRLAAGPDRRLHRANVRKRRFRFSVAGCSTELDQLLVNGAAIESVAVESEDPQAVLEALAILRLEARENQSYPLALSRILGLTPLPLEEDYG
jgi:hypothetical protein